MENTEVEKSRAFFVVEMMEYVSHAIVFKTIIKKNTGIISAIAFDSGENLAEKILPFDTLIQVIEGKAEIVIDDDHHTMEPGQSIIIPAHSRQAFKANERFKMLSTLIKSGYE